VKGWEDVRAEVLARIRARDWPPGATIPAEPELAATLGVARGTVHRALTDLARAGVLERRRKAGTRVAVLPVRHATFAIPVIRQEVAARGQVHAHRLLTRHLTVPPVAVAARAGLGPSAHMLFLETLHLADGRPHAFEVRWLNPAALPALPDFDTISANEWLVRNVSYSTGEIAFSAEAADLRTAQVMEVAPGAPLLVTDRATFAGDQAITLVRLFHAPGHRMAAAL
jgi:GntR family transcriptional regulator, histidine utilization repressor